ncbi:MAG: hypothetical protein M1818_002457 [Claussenomyces sp. TS43310]|nr:MAG: hypothetical protein M1818_002457 [Claussenomyces sp. TS43310]
MKVLTLNFVTCAVKACKASGAAFPLHPKDAELVQADVALNPKLLVNLLPRIDWEALRTTAVELGFPPLAPTAPTAAQLEAPDDAKDDEKDDGGAASRMMRDLHALLMETQINEGRLVCANCGHEYAVKEGIANFLLPNHLV